MREWAWSCRVSQLEDRLQGPAPSSRRTGSRPCLSSCHPLRCTRGAMLRALLTANTAEMSCFSMVQPTAECCAKVTGITGDWRCHCWSAVRTSHCCTSPQDDTFTGLLHRLRSAPTETLLPMVVGDGSPSAVLATCTTTPSCRFVFSPTVMVLTSPAGTTQIETGCGRAALGSRPGAHCMLHEETQRYIVSADSTVLFIGQMVCCHAHL